MIEHNSTVNPAKLKRSSSATSNFSRSNISSINGPEILIVDNYQEVKFDHLPLSK